MSADERILQFLVASGITPEYTAEMGCAIATNEEVAAASGYPLDELDPDGAIRIPYPGVTTHDGSPYCRYRQAARQPKYLGSQGHDAAIYAPIHYDRHQQQTTLYIVEGEKKAASLDCLGLRALGVGGVYSWPDAGYRLREKANGEPVCGNTRPHATLLKEALTANRIIIVGDSDLRTNGQARRGFDSLVSALDRYVNDALIERASTEEWKPIDDNRVAIVSLALVHPNQNSDAKVGIDDLIVQLLAEHDREATYQHIVQYLRALALGSAGADDRMLARHVAIANQQTLAYRDKSWIGYQQDGIWRHPKSGFELLAPPKICESFEAASAILSAKKNETLGDYKKLPKKDWPKPLQEFAEQAAQEVKAMSSAVARLKSTRGQRDILAQAAPLLYVPHRHWDAHDHSIATPQGLIDLRTGKVSPHRPSNLLTYATDVDFKPLATCDEWTRFMEQVQPDHAVRGYLQALIGYCATGLATQQEIYFFVGTGGNGKGTFKEVLRYVLGPYACTGAKTLLMKHPYGVPHPTDLATLDGKRWVTVSELEDGGALDTPALKFLSGGDTLTARKMHQDFFDFQMKATITVDTNDIPHIGECSPAMRRRLVIIDWPYRALIPDSDLPTRLKGEGSGILNWVIEGARMFYAGYLHPNRRPAAIVNATNQLWDAFDTLAQWLANECVLDESAETDITVLARGYNEWCKQNMLPEPKRHAVSKKLRLSNYPCRKTNGKVLYKGIRLRTEAESQMEDFDEAEERRAAVVPGRMPMSVETTNAPAPARKARRLLQ
jgi:P4 family phage/plasmid primase-like protien